MLSYFCSSNFDAHPLHSPIAAGKSAPGAEPISVFIAESPLDCRGFASALQQKQQLIRQSSAMFRSTGTTHDQLWCTTAAYAVWIVGITLIGYEWIWWFHHVPYGSKIHWEIGCKIQHIQSSWSARQSLLINPWSGGQCGTMCQQTSPRYGAVHLYQDWDDKRCHSWLKLIILG